jgi:hypothetical protein
MKYNQNEKLKQMDLSTMVVGVDIGSELHYARAFDYRGFELSGIFKIIWQISAYNPCWVIIGFL